jgi:hypothetical protein
VAIESCNASRIAVNMGEQAGMERVGFREGARVDEAGGALRGVVTTV